MSGKNDVDDGLRANIIGYLKAHRVMTLATSAGDAPWAAGVFYVSHDFTMYFFSDPKSRHCANVRRNPAASAAIHENYADWREIRGLQIEGRVEEVSAAEMPAMMGAYVAKFPFVRDLLTPEGLFRIGGKAIDARFYKLMPSRCVLLDNGKGFSHREEFVVS
jgi:uncharacterized protein YhbP (UPF0306 family)